jgi:hypothetical protein
MYFEMNTKMFIKMVLHVDNFSEYNKTSLYILRDGNFLDIKNIFASINGYKTNIGRGGSQKSHILSPMDLRLSFYMMAMFESNYKLISYLNTFNEITKDRYLSYTNKYFKNNISNTNDNKSLTLDNKYFKNNKSVTIGNK